MINIFICDLKSKEEVWHLVVSPNTTISSLLDEILGISQDVNVGVFGKLIDKSYTLQDNDRVEFYEDILIDPKIRRKKRVIK